MKKYETSGVYAQKKIKKLELRIPIGKIILPAELNLVKNSQNLVIFAHGSGSSRLSPRNRYVAEYLNRSGLSTLLFDLLTEKEDSSFDIKLVTRRLEAITIWALENPETKDLNYGYFGASTGCAAALRAAADFKDQVGAIVSRGGRLDLTMDTISEIETPTLFIVGGLDDEIISSNKLALSKMTVAGKLDIIPGASHLFEEQGKLETVAAHSANWFKKFLGTSS
jgi:dienelactone hydrolase